MMTYPPPLSRPSWRGRTNVDALTIAALEAAEELGGLLLVVTQGSYQGGAGDINSAGTHDGGGVVDLRSPDVATGRAIVAALRRVGFAAWLRTPAQGPWPYHVHAVLIGHPALAPSAARQVEAYLAGRNGLASNGPDDGPRLNPIPRFTYPPEDAMPTAREVADALIATQLGVIGTDNTIPLGLMLRQAHNRAGAARQNAAAATLEAKAARDVARQAVTALGEVAQLVGDTKLTPEARTQLAAEIAARTAAEVERLDAEALASRLRITVDDEENQP